MGGRSSSSGLANRSAAERIQDAMNSSSIARAFFERNANMIGSNATQEEFASLMEIAANGERLIDRSSFTDEGGGQWTLDIDGVGGVQILNERDSSRAGFGSGPAYGITVWDANYRMDEQQIYYTSLNEAKQIAKSLLKDKLTGR